MMMFFNLYEKTWVERNDSRVSDAIINLSLFVKLSNMSGNCCSYNMNDSIDTFTVEWSSILRNPILPALMTSYLLTTPTHHLVRGRFLSTFVQSSLENRRIN